MAYDRRFNVRRQHVEVQYGCVLPAATRDTPKFVVKHQSWPPKLILGMLPLNFNEGLILTMSSTLETHFATVLQNSGIWDITMHVTAVLDWIWWIVVNCGWLWLTVVDCGQLLSTVVDRGWLWLTTTNHSQKITRNLAAHGPKLIELGHFDSHKLWLTWLDCRWPWFAFSGVWLIVVDCG